MFGDAPGDGGEALVRRDLVLQCLGQRGGQRMQLPLGPDTVAGDRLGERGPGTSPGAVRGTREEDDPHAARAEPAPSSVPPVHPTSGSAAAITATTDLCANHVPPPLPNGRSCRRQCGAWWGDG